jgi:hypothetical protein
MKKLTWSQILLILSTVLNILGGTSVIPPAMGGTVCPPAPVAAPKPAPADYLDAGSVK